MHSPSIRTMTAATTATRNIVLELHSLLLCVGSEFSAGHGCLGCELSIRVLEPDSSIILSEQHRKFRHCQFNMHNEQSPHGLQI